MKRGNRRYPARKTHPSRRLRPTPRVSRALVLALAVSGVLPRIASAHTSQTVAPADLMRFWSPDPLVVVGVLTGGWLYARGTGRLREAGARTGRGPVIGTGRIIAFWCGLLTLFIALASPLDTATATVFSAHMIQHVLLIAVAPPLLLLGSPLTVMMNGLPRSWRRPLARTGTRPLPAVVLGFLTLPAVAWILHATTLWLWHEPALYQAAVRHEGIHLAEHATFVITALLYWWTIVPASRTAKNSLGPGMGILSVFAMGMQGAALGALLTFWGGVIYPVYIGRSELWGFSALSDQRLAGLIMWIPAGSIYVVAALMLLGQWFRLDGEQSSLPPSADRTIRAQAGEAEHGPAVVG
ncbi:MAG: cytochrome c oxidase assembly protein [Thermomicrobiales bacterium]